MDQPIGEKREQRLDGGNGEAIEANSREKRGEIVGRKRRPEKRAVRPSAVQGRRPCLRIGLLNVLAAIWAQGKPRNLPRLGVLLVKPVPVGVSPGDAQPKSHDQNAQDPRPARHHAADARPAEKDTSLHSRWSSVRGDTSERYHARGVACRPTMHVASGEGEPGSGLRWRQSCKKRGAPCH